MTDIQDVFRIKNKAANWTMEEVRQQLLPTIDLLADKLDALLRSPYRQNIYPVLLGLITLLRVRHPTTSHAAPRREALGTERCEAGCPHAVLPSDPRVASGQAPP